MAEEEKKHFANKQLERHHERAFGGKETPGEEHMEGHHSFHVAHHPEHGTHSTHTHAGGIDHMEHGSPEEAMEHGKQVMGGAAPMTEGATGDDWGSEE